MSKTAFVTGVSGQDGAYLSKFLIEKGYRVIGGDRRTASGSLWRLSELGIKDKIEIVDFELAELTNIQRSLEKCEFDEIYNLGAQSFVGSSFETPLMTSDITGLGVTRILECIRRYSPQTKFYQASTSEMFGRSRESPQNEKTPFYPRSPYGVAKLYAHWMTINYRESYDLFACSGILFNHESPLRGEEFVTRKISIGVANYSKGLKNPIELGNLSPKRDWGFAGDYVSGMWMMLQHERPDDYILASSENHSVREFVESAFACIDVAVEWEGKGKNEIGRCRKSGDVLVKVNPLFYRPAEVEELKGDYTKAKTILGWEPKKSFEDLVKIMVKSDLKRL